jgi:DNA excision repair protein ERCC-8
MNRLLLERSTGLLGPQAFARIHTAELIHAIQPRPTLRFDGGEKESAVLENEAGESIASVRPVESKIWAHLAGVNALALDIEGRM